ncbi:hypothetical protein T484DRAFT_1866331, partial [Baffinella frigidus]
MGMTWVSRLSAPSDVGFPKLEGEEFPCEQEGTVLSVSPEAFPPAQATTAAGPSTRTSCSAAHLRLRSAAPGGDAAMNSGRAGRQGEPLWPADPRFHPAGGGGRRYDPSHDTRPEQRPEQRDAYRADYAPSADSRLSYEQGDPDWRGSPYSGGTPHHGGQDRRSTPQQPGSGEQHRAAPRHTGHAGEDGTGGAYAYRPASGGRGAAPAARGGEGRELSNPPESAVEVGLRAQRDQLQLQLDLAAHREADLL